MADVDPRKQLLLWLDLETNGDSPLPHEILEIGAILTKWDLTPVGQFHSLVMPMRPDYREVAPQAVKEMHTVNGLWDGLEDNWLMLSYIPTVTDRICRWISDTNAIVRFPRDTPVRLCGSGVSHFDSKFILMHMNKLWEQLEGYSEYVKPTADIGVLRRLFKIWGLETAPNVDMPHRAIADVENIIEQARWYRSHIQILPVDEEFRFLG